jgi:hypothetical protein
MQEVDALQVLEKGDDVAFVSIGALSRRARANQVVVEIERQERPTLK